MSSHSIVLSEYDSKCLLRDYGITTVNESLASDAVEAAARAREIGFPVALKLCAAGIAHKTERNLVRLGLDGEEAVRAAARELLSRRRPEESDAHLLVQKMVGGRRELIVGLTRDRQFGPCVMLGAGGILAEVMRSIVFRVAPLSRFDAFEMMEDLNLPHLLGPFRGEPPVDREALAAVVMGVGRLGMERPEVVSVDVNPLIVCDSIPVAVDALVERRDGV